MTSGPLTATRTRDSLVSLVAFESAEAGTERFDLSHPYFEIVYGPLLGPAATLLARALARRLGVSTRSLDLRSLALEVGLRSSDDVEPLGRRSTLYRALERLEHLHIVRLVGSTLHVRRSVPPVPDQLLQRLPAEALSTHNRFVPRR
jgi:hypothetical protein